jgi:hypothetical protein
MKISKQQLQNIIMEEMESFAEDRLLRKWDKDDSRIPHIQSYEKVMGFLGRNPDLVWKGIKKVMDITGSTCPRSTAIAVSDYLAKL